MIHSCTQLQSQSELSVKSARDFFLTTLKSRPHVSNSVRIALWAYISRYCTTIKKIKCAFLKY